VSKTTKDTLNHQTQVQIMRITATRRVHTNGEEGKPKPILNFKTMEGNLVFSLRLLGAGPNSYDARSNSLFLNTLDRTILNPFPLTPFRLLLPAPPYLLVPPSYQI